MLYGWPFCMWVNFCHNHRKQTRLILNKCVAPIINSSPHFYCHYLSLSLLFFRTDTIWRGDQRRPAMGDYNFEVSHIRQPRDINRSDHNLLGRRSEFRLHTKNNKGKPPVRRWQCVSMSYGFIILVSQYRYTIIICNFFLMKFCLALTTQLRRTQRHMRSTTMYVDLWPCNSSKVKLCSQHIGKEHVLKKESLYKLQWLW